jgi:putrescine transport system permease protein
VNSLSTWLAGRGGRTLVIAAPYLWLLIFFLAPFVVVVKISVSNIAAGIPPYAPLFGGDGPFGLNLSFEGYGYLISDEIYVYAYANSLINASITTVICLLIGYPMAYGIARARKAWQGPLLMLIILPFWTNFLLRVYAWIGILKNNGLINNFLMSLDLIDEPLTLLDSQFAVVLGMTYAYLPLMILPLYAVLEKMDVSLIEAASDLGAKPTRAFFSITVPLSAPGIAAGSMLVFIPAVGEYVIPTLLGGADTFMIGTQLWNEFFGNRDWPAASAVTVALVSILLAPLMLLQWVQGRQRERGL